MEPNGWAGWLSILIAVGSLLYARNSNKNARAANDLSAEANAHAEQASNAAKSANELSSQANELALGSNKMSKEANEISKEANERAKASSERVAFVVRPGKKPSTFTIENTGAVWSGIAGVKFSGHRLSWLHKGFVGELNPSESIEQWISDTEWTVKPGQQVAIIYYRDVDKYYERETWPGIVQENPAIQKTNETTDEARP